MAKDDEDQVSIESIELTERDEFDGFALYPWSGTDSKPTCIVLDEDDAMAIARLMEGGCEVRRCIVRVQDHARDRLGELMHTADSTQEAYDAMAAKRDMAEKDCLDAEDRIKEEREKANVMRRVLTDFSQTITAMQTQIDVLDLTEK